MSEAAIKKNPEKILVFITPDSEIIKAIDMAERRSKTMGSELICLSIESPYYDGLSAKQKNSLRQNIDYVNQRGLPHETIVGSDPVYLIKEYCLSNHITLLYMTRSLRHHWSDRFRRSISRELLESLPDLTIALIPGAAFTSHTSMNTTTESGSEMLKNLFRTLFILAVMTILCFIFDISDADDSILAPIYILGVLLVAVQTTKWYWPLIAAALSIGLFDFFFASPRLSFRFYNPALLLVFAVTFVISLVAGIIAQRLHNTSIDAERSSWRAQILLDTTHLMENTQDPQEVIPALNKKLSQVTQLDVCFFPCSQDMLLDPLLFPSPAVRLMSHDEVRAAASVAKQAFERKTSAGAWTDISPDCPYLFVPWKTGDAIYGVSGVRIAGRRYDSLEKMILNAVVAEGSSTLEARQKAEEIARISQEVAAQRQRSNMLKAVSHDLRTPLTSIIGNVANIRETIDFMDKEQLTALCDELQDNSMTLYNMVENLLTAARLDNNSLKLRSAPDLIEDVIEAGLQQPRKINRTHPIEVHVIDDFLMANMDSSLITQVISNMVINAVQHTPEGTPIDLYVSRRDDNILVEIKDQGNGVSDQMKQRIFDLFYTGDKDIADADHFLGLGLYLCRKIIDAHNGTIYVEDNEPKGCVFAFTLPIHELNSVEN